MKRNSKRRRKEAKRLMSIYRAEVRRINRLKQSPASAGREPQLPMDLLEKAKTLSPGSQFNERRRGTRRLKPAVVPSRLPRAVRREAARERARQEWRSSVRDRSSTYGRHRPCGSSPDDKGGLA